MAIMLPKQKLFYKEIKGINRLKYESWDDVTEDLGKLEKALDKNKKNDKKQKDATDDDRGSTLTAVENNKGKGLRNYLIKFCKDFKEPTAENKKELSDRQTDFRDLESDIAPRSKIFNFSMNSVFNNKKIRETLERIFRGMHEFATEKVNEIKDREKMAEEIEKKMKKRKKITDEERECWQKEFNKNKRIFFFEPLRLAKNAAEGLKTKKVKDNYNAYYTEFYERFSTACSVLVDQLEKLLGSTKIYRHKSRIISNNTGYSLCFDLNDVKGVRRTLKGCINLMRNDKVISSYFDGEAFSENFELLEDCRDMLDSAVDWFKNGEDESVSMFKDI